MKEDTRIRLMAIILDRGRGSRAAELFAGYGLPLHYGTPGRGTANSELLDYLGLGETEKDVVFSLVPGFAIPGLLRAAEEKLQRALLTAIRSFVQSDALEERKRKNGGKGLNGGGR